MPIVCFSHVFVVNSEVSDNGKKKYLVKSYVFLYLKQYFFKYIYLVMWRQDTLGRGRKDRGKISQKQPNVYGHILSYIQ